MSARPWVCARCRTAEPSSRRYGEPCECGCVYWEYRDDRLTVKKWTYWKVLPRIGYYLDESELRWHHKLARLVWYWARPAEYPSPW